MLSSIMLRRSASAFSSSRRLLSKETLIESAQVSIDRDYLLSHGHIQAGQELRKHVSQLKYEGISKLIVRPAEAGGGRHFDIVPVLDRDALVAWGNEDDMWDVVRAQLQADLSSSQVVSKAETNAWQVNELEPLSSISGSSDSHKAGTEDKLWAAKQINMNDAWLLSQGSGVFIAHPDTGFRRHPELDPSNVLESIDYDYYEEDEEAEASDGDHGLATGSVLVSRHNRKGVFGGSPGSNLIPLRVTAPFLIKPGPVLLGFRRLRKAINYAHYDVGADVVSVSLGGIWQNTGLRNAITNAYNSGMIIVAAAGNHTRWAPVYPAAYDEVIGCSACNIEGGPWSGSAWGSHAEITAPGESVWRANYEDLSPTVGRSSGTSYATPHIASLAALWLSYHGGRQMLLYRCHAAGQPARTIGDTFRSILATTSQAAVIDSNNPGRTYGPLVDAAAVLQEPLPF